MKKNGDNKKIFSPPQIQLLLCLKNKNSQTKTKEGGWEKGLQGDHRQAKKTYWKAVAVQLSLDDTASRRRLSAANGDDSLKNFYHLLIEGGQVEEVEVAGKVEEHIQAEEGVQIAPPPTSGSGVSVQHQGNADEGDVAKEGDS